jgi:hypothetical protein
MRGSLRAIRETRFFPAAFFARIKESGPWVQGRSIPRSLKNKGAGVAGSPMGGINHPQFKYLSAPAGRSTKNGATCAAAKIKSYM